MIGSTSRPGFGACYAAGVRLLIFSLLPLVVSGIGGAVIGVLAFAVILVLPIAVFFHANVFDDYFVAAALIGIAVWGPYVLGYYSDAMRTLFTEVEGPKAPIRLPWLDRIRLGIAIVAVLSAYAWAFDYLRHHLPQPAPHLVSVRELDRSQRLSAICESVQDDALKILLSRPNAADDRGRMAQEVSKDEARTLWLADYSCWSKRPSFAY